MAKIAIYDGYGVPGFGAHRRKRKGGPKRMKDKMKACAKKWKHSRKHGKYTSFMKKCLRSRR